MNRWLRVITTSIIVSMSTLALATPESCVIGEGVPTTSRGIPDRDGDGVSDAIDNCVEVANPTQTDSNGDGFGNRCDADLNNDGVVNAVDLGLLRSVFFTSDADADLNEDGIVNVQDLGILRSYFFMAPGPQGQCLDGVSCIGPAQFGFDPVGLDEPVPMTSFIFETNDPEVIYHARRLLNGQTTCNAGVAANIEQVAQPYNPMWTFSMIDNVSFHRTSIDPLEVCDSGSALVIENDFLNWCKDGGGDTSPASTQCNVWCPWRSTLVEEF